MNDDPILFCSGFLLNSPKWELIHIWLIIWQFTLKFLNFLMKFWVFQKIENRLKSFWIFPHQHFGSLEKIVLVHIFIRQCALSPLEALAFSSVKYNDKICWGVSINFLNSFLGILGYWICSFYNNFQRSMDTPIGATSLVSLPKYWF